MTATFVPFQRRPIRAINRIGELLEGHGVPSADLSADTVRRRAADSTGLSWVADAQAEEALDVLCASITEEARLSTFGALVIRARLHGLLTTRLRVAELIRTHPEITAVTITPPVVIAGLQRSGTTMLHRLIAADPGIRAVGSWEVIHLLPPKWEKPGRPTMRVAQTTVAEWALRYLNPKFFAIHAVEADGPEEDVLLQEYSLLSQVPEAMLDVPSYARWLRTQDMHGSYEYLKILLQILHLQNPRPNWVLKTPAHLEHLDTLLDVFPDALIVQTHRDPLRTTASFSSMLAHGHSMFSDRVDAERVARHWLSLNGEMVNRALDVRARRPDAFLDVGYDDLVEDPIGQVERIYAAVDLELTGSIRTRMEHHRSGHSQHAHGVHTYTLEEFGLSVAEVETVYARYRAEFDL
ncbi:sulfotransferase family protein [Gordonia hankookensis]|uniref:Sulfotransferase n=1 Tax=Gordonia hankookensis TaxID=589403 RepID=A0ABR7WBW3_9ACTN|nr:sulfotransferase [Gordonia hankookensis]MBD1320115.1 sulfotransferase [Gordonia hankookensis]